ncbi:unnamed protein product, partial [Urochloa humidicola]
PHGSDGGRGGGEAAAAGHGCGRAPCADRPSSTCATGRTSDGGHDRALPPLGGHEAATAGRGRGGHDRAPPPPAGREAPGAGGGWPEAWRRTSTPAGTTRCGGPRPESAGGTDSGGPAWSRRTRPRHVRGPPLALLLSPVGNRPVGAFPPDARKLACPGHLRRSRPCLASTPRCIASCTHAYCLRADYQIDRSRNMC